LITKNREVSLRGVKSTAYYKVSSLILGKEEPFSFEEIKREIERNLNLFGHDKTIRKSLRRLRDTGLIIEHGSFYSRIRQ